ncbi:hypothetical protein BaRGS_00019930, partial [Batillaria attramentaria]
MGLRIQTSMTMWNPKVASRRLLMFAVLLVLCVVMMRVLWGTTTVALKAGSYRGDSLLFESDQTGSSDLMESPVRVPGTRVTVMSAVYRRHFPTYKHHSLMLTGWMEITSTFDNIVCCLATSENPFTEHTQIRALVHHMNDVQAKATDARFCDVHFICALPDESDLTFSVVSFSSVSCESSQDKSGNLVVHRPYVLHSPFVRGAEDTRHTDSGVGYARFDSKQNRNVWHTAISKTQNDIQMSEDGHLRSFQPVITRTGDVDTVHKTPAKRSDRVGQTDTENERHFSKHAGQAARKAQLTLAACVGLVTLEDVKNVLKIIEWVEYYRTMGVERIQLFYEKAEPGVLAVLEFYRANGFLNALRWNFCEPPRLTCDEDAQKQTELWQDMMYNDCLHRLSSYKFILFTQPEKLFLPAQQNATLSTALQSLLNAQPQTATVRLKTQTIPPCERSDQDQGQGERGQGRSQAFTNDLACPPAGNETVLEDAWVTLPLKVAYVAHRLTHAPLTDSDT